MDARDLAVHAANLWAARLSDLRLIYVRPDELNRREEAVDLLGRDSCGRPRLVLEHTLVESFLNQRSKQIAAVAMLGPLESQFNGQLPGPGYYRLTLKPGIVPGRRREIARIRGWVAEWVRETAPRLALANPMTNAHHFETVAVPKTKLEVSLHHFPRRDGQLQLVFEAPEDMRTVLSPSLERAIDAKCPKLATAKNDNRGAASLLLLEISDIALGDLSDLDAVVQARFAPPSDNDPDHIWLVDSVDDPPSVMISKEGGQLGGEIADRFLPGCSG